MRLDILEAVSEAEPRPGRVNEDVYGAIERAVWVLDGATGIAEQRILPGPSDARWVVDIIDAALRREVDHARPVAEVMRDVARMAMAAFARDALRRGAPAMDMPCACLALLRLVGTRLEFATIGDCRILHRRTDGSLSCFGSSKLSALDEGLRQEVIRWQATGLRHDEVWPLILPSIRRNRGLMNEAEGYWILDLSERWIEHVETMSVIAVPSDVLLLVTDGFWRLVDIYGRYDAESLFGAALSGGLRPLAAELRAIEAADEECRRHPRLKTRDDATAVLVRIAEYL
jgi:serine/threonine protein phosphatase PrpC